MLAVRHCPSCLLLSNCPLVFQCVFAYGQIVLMNEWCATFANRLFAFTVTKHKGRGERFSEGTSDNENPTANNHE